MGELFCGPGGLGLGALSASNQNILKIKPIWANDIDSDSCLTYLHNIHNGLKKNVICKAIENLDLENIPELDALSFGFPCNDFSIVGKHLGTKGKYGPLYTYGVKVINIRSPLWFIAENVSGLESANSGEAFRKILYDLENAGKGYFLTAHKYKFEEYGVPQSRHRIIIVGIRKDLNLRFLVPKPLFTKKYKTVGEALEIPPIPVNASNHEFTTQSKIVQERLSFIPEGENAWYEKIPKRLQLKQTKTKLSNIYKRLSKDKPSYTITGSGGGGTHVYHWKENRALTNRERARLQTFPDHFLFSGSKESVRKQIGMAVPPEGAKVIFDAILKTFQKNKYEYVYSDFGEQTDKLL